jgi:hypothetical protein
MLFRKWRLRFGPGKALLLLYTWAGTLCAPLLLHMANNALGIALGEWGPLRVNVDTWWKLASFVPVLLIGGALWLRFLLQSWHTLSDPLPPDSLQPAPVPLPSVPQEPLSVSP